MRLFLDANVLFTDAHNPKGKAALAIELGAHPAGAITGELSGRVLNGSMRHRNQRKRTTWPISSWFGASPRGGPKPALMSISGTNTRSRSSAS